VDPFVFLISWYNGAKQAQKIGYGSSGPGFDSQRYQIFCELVSLERGPLSLVSTTEELLGRKSSGCGLETENAAVWIRCADQATHPIHQSCQ
jgi:hypothetical protein